MRRTILITATAALTIALGAGAYLSLPAYYEKRQHLHETFTAFERVAAAVDSGAGILEFKHRLVEATAAMDRMDQLEPQFRVTEVGKELDQTWQHYRSSTDWWELDEVRSKDVLLRYPEIPLTPPTAKSLKLYRDAVRYGVGDADVRTSFLEPWVSGEALMLADVARAKGYLTNAQILAGRKQGEMYTAPKPREESQWRELLPIEHPARAKDLEARDARLRAQAEAKRAAAAAAAETHRRAFPLHVDLKGLYYARGTFIWIDGKKWEYDFSEGHEEHIDAKESVEIDSFYAHSIPLSVSVNGKSWDVRRWSWVGNTYVRKRTTITVQDAQQLLNLAEAPR